MKYFTPTVYNSKQGRVLFRSRLEARWAVYFDAMGRGWRYEPKQFKLKGSAPYTPDFLIDELGWIEIKPTPEAFEQSKPSIAAFTRQEMKQGDRMLLLASDKVSASNVFAILPGADLRPFTPFIAMRILAGNMIEASNFAMQAANMHRFDNAMNMYEAMTAKQFGAA